MVGYFLVDRYLSSYPWGSLSLTLLGAGAGLYEIIKILIPDQRSKGEPRCLASNPVSSGWEAAWSLSAPSLTALIFGVRSGASFLAGGLLSAANLAMLRHTVNSALLRRSGKSDFRIAAVICCACC